MFKKGQFLTFLNNLSKPLSECLRCEVALKTERDFDDLLRGPFTVGMMPEEPAKTAFVSGREGSEPVVFLDGYSASDLLLWCRWQSDWLLEIEDRHEKIV